MIEREERGEERREGAQRGKECANIDREREKMLEDGRRGA